VYVKQPTINQSNLIWGVFNCVSLVMPPDCHYVKIDIFIAFQTVTQ